MEIIKKNIDIEKEQYREIYAIHKIEEFFETTAKQEGNISYSIDNKIHSIILEADFNQLTIYFGNFGHIHLSGKELKAFVDGINEICKKFPTVLRDRK